MRIVVCHNFYQRPGGEDQVFHDEVSLLEAHGHHVVPLAVHNDAIRLRSRLAVAAGAVWSRRGAAEVAELARREKADVVHFHNTFPLISPAAYYAARLAGAAVVQTLHNFRLLCPAATFHRDDNLCESCLHRLVPWPAVVHRCYRGSGSGSAVVAGMLVAHRLMRTWTRAVDRYVALTEYSRQKFLEGGLPAERVMVKGNFVSPSPAVGEGCGGYALFVGRLVPEKGIDTLLAAWELVPEGLPLKIVGDGPLADRVAEAARGNRRIEWLGPRPHAEVLDLLGNSRLLVIPSTWYEGFPKTLAEALAKGTPVVASRLGALAELIDEGRTGVLFEPRSATDLAATLRTLVADPERVDVMRRAARAEFEEKHSAEGNYRRLMEIYREALTASGKALGIDGRTEECNTLPTNGVSRELETGQEPDPYAGCGAAWDQSR